MVRNQHRSQGIYGPASIYQDYEFVIFLTGKLEEQLSVSCRGAVIGHSLLYANDEPCIVIYNIYKIYY